MDITGKIGPLWTIKSGSDWPMYSYERPAYIVWNAIANELHDLGWTDIQIKDWLQSKSPRWELDGQLGDILTRVVKKYAKVINSNPYWQARARKRG